MSYSPSLVYFLDRLSGFSTNVFKLEPQGSTSAQAHNISRITLPSNALLNTRSFKLHFFAKTSGGTTSAGRLPAKIDTLIERVEVSAGGVQLSQGSNFYNVLVHAKEALMGSRTDSVTGHPVICKENTGVTGADADTGDMTDASSELALATQTPFFCVDKWEGFLGSCEPKILDASILPDLVVSIYWADNSVCTSCQGLASEGDFTKSPSSGSVTYVVSNIYATIETIGLADAVYDNMVSSMIASKGFVEIPFKQYFAFQNTHTGSSRFTVATQSLDRIWLTWRDSTYNTQGAPMLAHGYVEGDENDTYVTFNRPSDEKYIGKYYQFKSTGVDKVQLQLNGAYYPQFPADIPAMYQITKNSLLGNPCQHELTLDQYKSDYFVQCVRLNMPESEFSRTISGLDTRSVSLNGYINAQISSGTPVLNIFAECTSTLRIGSGRQLEVII